ncbi:MAG: hypothetical protein SR1Q5_07070 [Quinella sp. 1Q5]|nr:hypothetical protein [Quinella sp. 1Q5]
MQKIDDLREILTAIQDIGNAWQAENIKLREENDRLLDKNGRLRETYDRLTKQNESLRQDIKNLLEETKRLIENLRDDLINELAADKQEDFQKFVRDYLRKLRKASSTPTTKAEETKPSTPSNKPY